MACAPRPRRAACTTPWTRHTSTTTRPSGRVLERALDLERREISGPAPARMLVRYPAMTAQGFAAIHGHAIRLRRKGVPECPHPGEDAESRGSLEVAAR
ncbi:MAG: DUF1365 family protein [Deltaproteobacteria bacterium]|nr:DUF1365 family protein [Deltaproteobacteria bacterium]MBW2371156.1 DUF1365 family protein [Deltaproteobacteria bacterium]